MAELSPITKQFLEQVKGATIAQLIEADKANWLGRKDMTLSYTDIKDAMAEGTLTRKVGKDGNVTSSATSITSEEAKKITEEIRDKYPHTVTMYRDHAFINFRALKAEIDPEYRKLYTKPKDEISKGSNNLEVDLKNMDEAIRQAQKGQGPALKR